MSISDPFSVAAFGAVPATSWGIIARDGFGSTRADLTNGYFMKITHSDPTQPGQKFEKHYLQVTQPKDVTDPVSGLVKRVVASVSLSVSIPSAGWTYSQKVDFVNLLVNALADGDFSTNRFVTYDT